MTDAATSPLPPFLRACRGIPGGPGDRVQVWFMRQAFVIGGKQPAPVETKAGRRGVNTNYHSTWLEARAHLMEDAQFADQSKRRQLELANAYLGNVKGLKAPDSAVVAQ